VKKLTINAIVTILFAGLFWAPGVVFGQDERAVDRPHRIGLIDMARVFKSYKKFEALRDELKGDLQKSEDKFKQMAEQIRREQNELKQYKEGTDEYTKTENLIVRHTTQAETYRKTTQRDLVRREAQIYKTIYLEVADAVQKYARLKNYTLVLRFSSDEVEASENPEDVMRGLNRQVVYYRPSDDITVAIVAFLNNRYQTASRAADTAPSRN
jgi:Skp family chaperone for outer membrane proteins